MSLNWSQSDYFKQLLLKDNKAHTALELLVDDLHADKDKTINKFLSHSGSEDFLWGLIKLLASEIPRVAGNSAYILGTIAENDVGCYRVLSITTGSKPASRNILPDLTRMLQGDDPESVMNAAGTMGTLAETNEGRQWMLSESCLASTIEHISNLLHNENLWTASNAALVLARISISEQGCLKILEHPKYTEIIPKLISSLGIDEAGRGMNAAFAIGRLCDMEEGRTMLLSLPESEKMISTLAKMLCYNDPGASKNACFAMSCLAADCNGHGRLLKNSHSDEVIRSLAELLSAEDSETGWFSAMTLRTLASQPKGCQRLRDHPEVSSSLQEIAQMPNVSDDLCDEVNITLEILKRLKKPSPPIITVTGSETVSACWEEMYTKSGFELKYQLFDGTKCYYQGKDLECTVTDLTPYCQYYFRVRVCTEIEESQFSDAVHITTDEAAPGPPENVRILGATVTQLKVGWDPPLDRNGVLKGYYVYNGSHQVEHTHEMSSIITGLTSNSTYDVQVCAATSKGKGPKAMCNGTTVEQGAHNPSKPHLHVLGRNEIYVTWDPPEVPQGKINKYEIMMNGKCIHSAIECQATARRLVPDKEYAFIVVAVTTEGKFESKVAKKKTSKDEHDSTRPPLYTSPAKKESTSSEESPMKHLPSYKKRRSTTESRAMSAASTKTTSDYSRPESAISSSTERIRSTPKFQEENDRGSSGQSSKSSGSSLKDSEPIKLKVTHSGHSLGAIQTTKPRQMSSKSRANPAREFRQLSSKSRSSLGDRRPSKRSNLTKTPSSDESDSTKHNERAVLKIELPIATSDDLITPRQDRKDKSPISNPPLLTGSGKHTWKLESLKSPESLNQDYGMHTTTQPFEEKTVEPDPDWMEYAKRLQRRYEVDVTGSQLSHLNLTPVPIKPNLDFMSPPAFEERAKTFINSHRPSRKPRTLYSSHITSSTATAAHWVPELPTQVQSNSSYNFIPLQMRSPPSTGSALPAPKIPRELTSLNFYGRGTRRIDPLNRSQTHVDIMKPRRNSSEFGNGLILRSNKIDSVERLPSASAYRH